MSGLDFRIVVHQFTGVIKEKLNRGIHITFLILDPNSSAVKIQSKRVFAGEDLKKSIKKTLKLLYQEKMKLPPEIRDRLVVRTYNSVESESIILIDKKDTNQDNNAWIKVEYRQPGSDANSRSSDSAFKEIDEEFFNKYLNKYDMLLFKSKLYKN